MASVSWLTVYILGPSDVSDTMKRQHQAGSLQTPASCVQGSEYHDTSGKATGFPAETEMNSLDHFVEVTLYFRAVPRLARIWTRELPAERSPAVMIHL